MNENDKAPFHATCRICSSSFVSSVKAFAMKAVCPRDGCQAAAYFDPDRRSAS